MIWAQATGGNFTGTVTTPSGSPVANAAVTITNTSTNVSQRVLTGPDGTFTISGLAPGSYKLEVESAGYKRTTQQNVELAAGGPAIAITLEPGSMSETVEIRGRAPMIQTDNSEVATGLNTRSVQELPVIDRDHQQLVQLQPGVTPPEIRFPLTQDAQRQREWNTNGQPYYANRQELDGVTNYEPMRGTAVRVVPAEAIQQYNVSTANYPENRGFAAGALTDVITRPGTNGWHGSLFEFHSNNKLHARSPFDITGDAARLTYNQFGLSLGGPIVTDRFFFFGSYEGNYNRGATSTVATVPTAAMRLGNFAGIPGVTVSNPFTGTTAGLNRTVFVNGMIPSAAISPVASALLPFIPSPNQPGLANNFVGNLPYSNDWHKLDAKIDAHFTEHTHGFLRYGFSNTHATQNSVFGGDLGLGEANRIIGQNAVFDVAHTHGNLMGDLRLGYNRYDFKQFPMGSQSAFAGALGLGGVTGQFLPTFDIGGVLTVGSPFNSPQRGVDNTYNLNTSWALRTSMHNVKWGLDIQHYRTDGFSNLFFGPMGTAAFGPGATLAANANPAVIGASNLFPNAFAAFLLNAPTATGSTFFATTPTARQTWYAAWVGDTLNFYRIVTVELGLRYEVYSPIRPRRQGDLLSFNPPSLSFADVNTDFGDYDFNNWAPRVGIAVRATPKTAIRAGWSMNYFRQPVMFSGIQPAIFGTFQGVTNGFTTVPGFAAANFPGVLPVPSVPANNLAANGPLNVMLDSRAQIPMVQHFNAQVQQEFVDGIVFGIGYQGALGRHLPFHYELNQGLPGTGLAGLPFIGVGRTASTLAYDYGVNSNYNALQVNLTKRMGHGLQFQGAYTWSKSLGYTGGNGFLLNPFNRRANYGPADFDRQHMLTIAHVWDLPFGTGTQHMNHGIVGQILGNWAINGVFTWATGTPFNVFANPLFFGGPNGTVLANVNGQVAFNDAGLNQPFFNAAAFGIPPSGTFGNQSRNFLRGPGFKNYNFSLFKTFAFMDHYKIEIRGEAYNLTNTPHFANPQANLNAGGFGEINSLSNGWDSLGRQINLALRLIF
jgi:hypothetical protein